ncbi:MAG: CARDB domain-containing protein [Planctomycetota bacterium]
MSRGRRRTKGSKVTARGRRWGGAGGFERLEDRVVLSVDTPDLVVTSVSAPTSATGGDVVSISWVVENLGNASTGVNAWSDRIVLSTDETFSIDDLSVIVPVDVPFAASTPFFPPDPLAAGENYLGQAEITLPNTLDGDFFVLVITDINSEVNETFFEGNNIGSQGPVAIAPPRPDLVISNQGLTSITPDGLATIGWTTSNIGQADAGAFQESAFSFPSLFELVNDVDGIPSGQQEVRSLTFPLLAGAGQYPVFLDTDSSDALLESDETNNDAPFFFDAALDLTVGGVSVDPVAAAIGQDVTVNWRTSNTGDLQAPAGVQETVEVVQDGAVIASTTATTTEVLPPGQFAERSAQVTLTPSEAALLGTPGVEVRVRTNTGGNVTEFSSTTDATQNNTASTPLTLTPPAAPELIVENVNGPADAAPGELIEVTWVVRNAGGAAASGPWRDEVAVSADDSIGEDIALGSFTFDGTLAAGESLARSAMVTVPPTGLSGDIRFVVTADALNSVAEVFEDNNAAIDADAPTSLPPVLTFSNVPQTVQESAGGSFLMTVSRSGDLSSALTVGLSSDASQLFPPAQVVIPAGQQSVSFTVGVVDDDLLDGDQAVELVATAAGFVTDERATLVVLDDEFLALGLTAGDDTLVEGEATTATVTRNGPTDQPLTVNLTTSSDAQLVTPESVVIPVGESSVGFQVEAFDDVLIETVRSVALQASAIGFVSDDAVQTLTINDNDAPNLSLTIAADAINEGDGVAATTGLVTIDAAQPLAVIVALESSDGSELFVPPAIVIPAGETSAPFTVSAVEDTLADGTQPVQVTATLTDTSTAEPIVGTEAVQGLDVLDNDGDTLSISIDRDFVAEGVGGAALVTMTRNSSPAIALTVSIAVSDPSLIDAPAIATVVIPADESSVTFAIDTLDDGQDSSIETVSLTASAPGFTGDTATVNVADLQFPDLVVESLAPVDAAVANEGSFEFGFTLRNAGLSDVVFTPGPGEPAELGVEFFLSTDTAIGAGDVLIAEFTTTQALLAGESISPTLTGAIPDGFSPPPGDYFLVGRVDRLNAVKEQDDALPPLFTAAEANNVGVSASTFRVEPALTATVFVDDPSGANVFLNNADDPLAVRLIGNAVQTLSPEPQAPAANAEVDVLVRTAGTVRAFRATTDANGDFEVVFTPLTAEAGDFTVAAAHPAEPRGEVADQASFTVLGIGFDAPFLAQEMVLGGETTTTLRLNNLSGADLTGVTATLTPLDVISDTDFAVEVELPVGGSLPGDGTLDVVVTTTSRGPAPSNPNPDAPNFELRLESSEGAVTTLPIFLLARSPVSSLNVAPTIEGSVVGNVADGGPDRTEAFEFTLTLENVGSSSTGNIGISLADGTSEAIRLVTPSRLSALQTGNEAVVTIEVAADLVADGPEVNGQLNISTSHQLVTVALDFEVLARNAGGLRLTVVDEFTQDLPGSDQVDPSTTVAGAEVVVRDAVTGEVVFDGLSNANGVVDVVEERFEELSLRQQSSENPLNGDNRLRSGFYTITIDSPRHAPLTVTRFLQPTPENSPTEIEAFISRETVQYTFEVEQAEGDETVNVVVTSTLDTTVTAAQVVVANPLIDIGGLEVGESISTTFQVSNAGTLPADSLQLVFEDHPFYEVTPLIAEVPLLLPGGEVLLPVTITKTGDPQPGDVSPRDIDGTLFYSYTSRGQRVTKSAPLWAYNADTPEASTQPAPTPSLLPLPEQPDFDPGDILEEEEQAGFGGFGASEQTTIGTEGVVPDPIRVDTLPDRVTATAAIEIDRSTVTTLDFFRATLELNNTTANPLEDIDIDIVVLDEQDNDVTDLFVVTLLPLNNLTTTSPTTVTDAELNAGAVGSAQWRIEPLPAAGGTGPTSYFVGGTLSFDEVVGGVADPVDIALSPVEITVEPLPELTLSYFLQTDVLGDDPLTIGEVEPSSPFSLGLVAENLGAGAARDLSIVAAVPQVVENSTGQLLDIQEVSATLYLDADGDGDLDAQSLPASRTVGIGDLAAGQKAIVVWEFTSSLQGQFIDYDVTVNFTDATGVDRFATFVSDTNVSGLVDVVQSDRPGDAAAPYFVFAAGGARLPDSVALSDGGVEPVNFVDAATATPASADNTVYTIEATVTPGFNFLRFADPSGGAESARRLVSVVRTSDGSVVPADNFYQTDRTFTLPGFPPTQEALVNLFDHNPPSDGLYTLTFERIDTTSPEVLSVDFGAPEFIDSVDSFIVSFSEPINLETFDPRDIALFLEDQPIATPVQLTITPTGPSQYEVSGFAGVTSKGGNFEVSVFGEGIEDSAGNAGFGQAPTSFFVDPVPAVVNAPVSVQGGLSQRSYVDTFSISFDSRMDFAPLIASGQITSVVTLTNLGVDTTADADSEVPLSASQFSYAFNPSTGQSILTWTLDSAGQTSLANGLYTLTINGDGVNDFTGLMLDGDGDGVAGGAFESTFHRLEGDVDGNRVVDGLDLDQINAALGSRSGQTRFDADADLDRDGRITVRDRIIPVRAISSGDSAIVDAVAPAAVAVFLPGDYNLSGAVEAADYTIWRNNLGMTGATPADGDGDGDGDVDANDYLVWRGHFGEDFGSFLAGLAPPALVSSVQGSSAQAESVPATSAPAAGPAPTAAVEATDAAFEAPADQVPGGASLPAFAFGPTAPPAASSSLPGAGPTPASSGSRLLLFETASTLVEEPEPVEVEEVVSGAGLSDSKDTKGKDEVDAAFESLESLFP